MGRIKNPHPPYQETVDPTLWAELIQLADGLPSAGSEATLLSHRSDRVVIRVGRVIIKAHAAGTVSEELAARLQLLSQVPLNEIFLAPLRVDVLPVAGKRLATLWPLGLSVENDLDRAPWEEAARLLAKLHRSARPGSISQDELPKCRAADRVMATLSQLEDQNFEPCDHQVKAVRSAAATLRLSAHHVAVPTTFVHGDWHFGQLVAISESEKKIWRLIDADDMGLGNPAWDLARPAAFFAAGLIPPDVWEAFLTSYRVAGGPAVPARGDPWITLDMPARALVVQCAASALIRSKRSQRPLSEAELPLIDACRRIARVSSTA